jgi:hypothetical protein
MRTASHVQKGGLRTAIIPTSRGSLEKLGVLSPDVPISQDKTAAMQVDIAGHYNDSRTNQDPREVPHLFAEDMDNPSNRGPTVPIYLKTGMSSLGRQVTVDLGGSPQNPMFYRPFREWELPEPGGRDVKSLLMRTVKKNKKGLHDLLDGIDNIAFGHFRPGIGHEVLEAPYFQAVSAASHHYDGKFAIGLFFSQNQEQGIAGRASSLGYTIYRSYGEVVRGDPRMPTLLFLGPQQQMTTSSLFVSATMPNIVTGDLSLSDALYGVIAMQAPGFFYDSPSWKMPSHREIVRILSKGDQKTALLYEEGSMGDFVQKSADAANLAPLFGNRREAEIYRTCQQASLLMEIEQRFGRVPIVGRQSSDGLYVKRGAPFLFQDAVETVLKTLAESPELLSDVDSKRNSLAGHEIAISSDVMAPVMPAKDYPDSPISKNVYGLELLNDSYNETKILEKLRRELSHVKPIKEGTIRIKESNKLSKKYELSIGQINSYIFHSSENKPYSNLGSIDNHLQ